MFHSPWVLLIILICGSANGRLSFETRCAAQSTPDLVNELRSNNASVSSLARAQKSDDPTILRAIEDLFDRTQDKQFKQLIAIDLARKIKIKNDDRYYLYLLSPAQRAVHDTSPNVEKVGKDGQPIPKTKSQEFVLWCEAHGRDPEEQAAIELISNPADIVAFAATLDLRGAPLLREGLMSRNLRVAYSSAYGLAILGSASDVKAVVEYARGLPPKRDLFSAIILAKFASPEAQAEVRKSLLPGSSLALRYEELTKAKKARLMNVGR